MRTIRLDRVSSLTTIRMSDGDKSRRYLPTKHVRHYDCHYDYQTFGIEYLVSRFFAHGFKPLLWLDDGRQTRLPLRNQGQAEWRLCHREFPW